VTCVIDADLEIGEPLRRGAMTIFPVLQPSGPAPREYLTGLEAADLVTIHEKAGGVVSELVAHNHADRPVLLIEGETLLGAKQDRTLNISILMAAGHDTTVPVSCVEAGRWGRSVPSHRSPSHAPPRLRERKTRSVVESLDRGGEARSDQGAVWAEVAAYESAVGSLSSTSALREVHEHAADQVEQLAPQERPTHRQVGVIVATGGRPTLLELFDDPATLDAYWRSLVEGYALDATLTSGTDTTTPAQADAFLEAARATTFESHPGVSLGDDLHARTDDLVATGISWGGHLLHLVCFASP